MIRPSAAALLAAVLLLAGFACTSAWSQPDPSEAVKRKVTQLYKNGNRFLNSRRYAEAERSFLDALKLAPDFSAIHHGLGLVYVQTQDYELAVLHLEEALRREPDQIKTVYALAKSYAALGENEKAKETYEHALRLNPQFEPALQDLAGVYYREKKWDEALAFLERAKQVNPRSAHTLMLIGVTGIHADRRDIALDSVTELRQRGYPDQARRLEYLIFSEKYETAAASKK